MSTKKHGRRKLTHERVDAINRQRDLREGEPSIEHPQVRVFLDEDGRGVMMDANNVPRNAE